ncbi:hypothetical protein C8J57DRAFT_1470761 [Mycena rebaudengoi]|nr:hypothetical protein C8J57DRAFT_1470761 [Mycena rebaudengoi]
MSSEGVPVKPKSPTCELCRKRKLRCDGGNPCLRCSRARRPVVCTYTPKPGGRMRSELPKGAACITCRERKRSSNPCRYLPKKSFRRRRADDVHHAAFRDARESYSPTGFISDASTSRPSTPFYFAPDVTASLVLGCDYRELFDASDNSSAGFDTRESSTVPAGSAPAPKNVIVLPVLPDFMRRAEPPAIEKSRVCVNSQTFVQADELLYMRNLFLQHSWQLGLSISTAKREAISRGDPVGLVVQPVLIHVSQLMGYLLANHLDGDTWVYREDQTAQEAREYSAVLELLSARTSPPDSLARLQSYLLLAIYAAQKGRMANFQEFLGNAGEIAAELMASLGLDDPSPPDNTVHSLFLQGSELQEAREAVSELMYIDIARELLLTLPSPFDNRLLPKFRQLAAIHSTNTGLNFMRAQSALFLLDSRDLVATRGSNTGPVDWFQRYCSIVDQIHTQLGILRTAVMEASLPQAVTLKASIIMALAALLELYGLFARSDRVSYKKTSETIEEMVTIAGGFSCVDYPYLDPPVGICLSIAARHILGNMPMLDSEVANEMIPPGSESMLHIIRECHRGLALPAQNAPVIQYSVAGGLHASWPVIGSTTRRQRRRYSIGGLKSTIAEIKALPHRASFHMTSMCTRGIISGCEAIELLKVPEAFHVAPWKIFMSPCWQFCEIHQRRVFPAERQLFCLPDNMGLFH